jgi:3-oxoacyl-[acyl-carrier protein] reductase
MRPTLPELLVNASGLQAQARTAFLDALDLDAVLDRSLRATFLTCQQAVKAMAPRRFGRIVNFASPSAMQGGEGQPSRCRREGRCTGIDARAGTGGRTAWNHREAIWPGAIRTESLGEQSEAPIRPTPLRRAGTADEVAGMVNMLCADRADDITGQCLSIDGGLN